MDDVLSKFRFILPAVLFLFTLFLVDPGIYYSLFILGQYFQVSLNFQISLNNLISIAGSFSVFLVIGLIMSATTYALVNILELTTIPKCITTNQGSKLCINLNKLRKIALLELIDWKNMKRCEKEQDDYITQHIDTRWSWFMAGLNSSVAILSALVILFLKSKFSDVELYCPGIFLSFSIALIFLYNATRNYFSVHFLSKFKNETPLCLRLILKNISYAK